MALKSSPNFSIEIRKADFDIDLEISNVKSKNSEIGAVVSFLGVVRDISKHHHLKFMEIEHYPKMTEKVLEELFSDASERWQLQGISLIHRVGKLYPSENIVLLITASAHRSEAFNASEFIMDFLKSKAPFWKKETTATDSYWIEESLSDRQKVLRWDSY